MKIRHYITIGISAFIIVAWIIFLALPTHKSGNDIKKEIELAENQLADFTKIMSTLPEFYDSQKEMDEMKARLLSKLIPKKDILKLFDEIEKMARSSNVTITEITPSVEELLHLNRQLPDDNRPQILEIGLKLDGTIYQTGQLIKRIEQEEFYKGLTFCRIYNHLDNYRNSNTHYGFKAILGTIEDS